MPVYQRGHIGKRRGKRGTSWFYVITPSKHPVTREKRRQIWRRGFRLRRDAVEALNDHLARMGAEDEVLRRQLPAILPPTR